MKARNLILYKKQFLKRVTPIFIMDKISSRRSYIINKITCFIRVIRERMFKV